jgi:RimJ/RimL family protein N-acetyltransferase
MPYREVQTITLCGEVVLLEPLTEDHLADLTLAGKDPSIWRYLPYGELTNQEQMHDHIRWLLKRAAQGIDLPFTVINRETNQAIGMTRYLDIKPEHKKLEIGGTWYQTEYQRTKVNTESKYLLLEHAFDVLGYMRVQFKTDARNKRSQMALERINAVREGVLRNHMILPNGHVRDSVYYSITASEWPAVKALLKEKLAHIYVSHKY